MAQPAGAPGSGDGPASNPQTDQGAPSSDEVLVGQENRESCTPKFDALWFCYSPAYQLREYYITGMVDDCSGKWKEFVDCLKKRTSRYKEEVLAAEAEVRHPLWDLRTHKEAQQFWSGEFGHLLGQARQPGDEANGAHHSGRPTLV